MTDNANNNQPIDLRSTSPVLSTEIIVQTESDDLKYDLINLDAIGKIEIQMCNLRDVPRNNDEVSKMSEIALQFLSDLKDEYYNNCLKLRNELMNKNQISNDTGNANLSHSKTNSNSLPSISDKKMEIHESINALLSSIDLNKDQNRKVTVFRETSINTEINAVEDQLTQTIPTVINNNVERMKLPVLHQESIDIRNLIIKLVDKYRLVHEKFNRYFQVRQENLRDVAMNTEDYWSERWDLMTRAVDRLPEAENKLQMAEIDIVRMTSEKKHLMNKMVHLKKQCNELSVEMEEFSTEMSDLREVNEFLTTEHQGLVAQIDKLQTDWKASLTDHHNKLEKFKSEFREKNTILSLKNQSMDFQLSQEKIYNSGDKVEIEWLENRLDNVLKDVEKYPAYGTEWQQEMMEVKKKVTLLEDDRMRHAQEKTKWITQRERLVEELKNGNGFLTQENSALKNFARELKSDKEMLQEKFDRYEKCYEELQQVTLGLENQPVEKCIECCREILSKFGV